MDYFSSAEMVSEGNDSRINLTDPQIRYGHWGIAALAAFKLQWICSDRNIDRAPKGLGHSEGLGKSFNRLGPLADGKLLRCAPI